MDPPPREPRQPELKRTSHVLHLILALVTFGFWFFVWPLVHLTNQSNNAAEKRRYERSYEDYRRELGEWQTAQAQAQAQAQADIMARSMQQYQAPPQVEVPALSPAPLAPQQQATRPPRPDMGEAPRPQPLKDYMPVPLMPKGLTARTLGIRRPPPRPPAE
jgi:hypothetical protein